MVSLVISVTASYLGFYSVLFALLFFFNSAAQLEGQSQQDTKDVCSHSHVYSLSQSFGILFIIVS